MRALAGWLYTTMLMVTGADALADLSALMRGQSDVGVPLLGLTALVAVRRVALYPPTRAVSAEA